MILVAGLGNPGKEFLNTRHNIGRDVAAAFCKKTGLPDFRVEKKWKAEISGGKIGKEKIVILLPDTFMNKSGNAVAPAARFFKIKPKNIFLIHDDADIPLGRAKLSYAKHSAGHKGVESVIRALKTRDFWRFRIGIAGKRDIPAEKLVLRGFTPEETLLAKKITKKTVEAIEITLSDGPEKTMNEYNQ